MTSPPEQIGRYVVASELGSGGMGEVYLAYSPAGDPVAVKLIRADRLDPKMRQRFEKEALVARTVIGTSRVARFLDADPFADRPWMAMEYVPGQTLHACVEASGPLPPVLVASLGALLAEGLSAVHSAGLLHRDIKPQNIILGDYGPVLIDFGLAAFIDRSIESLSRTGTIIGTPRCMSPEQASGNPHVTTASDVYSLGAVLLYAAAGHYPYAGDTWQTIIAQVASPDHPPDLSGVSDALRPLVASDDGPRVRRAAGAGRCHRRLPWPACRTGNRTDRCTAGPDRPDGERGRADPDRRRGAASHRAAGQYPGEPSQSRGRIRAASRAGGPDSSRAAACGCPGTASAQGPRGRADSGGTPAGLFITAEPVVPVRADKREDGLTAAKTTGYAPGRPGGGPRRAVAGPHGHPDARDGWMVEVTGVSPFVRGMDAVFYDRTRCGQGPRPAARPGWCPTTPRTTAGPACTWRRSSARRSCRRPSTGWRWPDNFLMDQQVHQLRPAELALSMRNPQPRLLIADVVGLGKTLEIGVLLAELIRRGRGERILVVSPAHVLEQFQRELWTRFAIPLVRLDSTGIQRVQQEIPAGRNPFAYFKRAIISVDTLKSDVYATTWRTPTGTRSSSTSRTTSSTAAPRTTRSPARSRRAPTRSSWPPPPRTTATAGRSPS